MKIKPFLLPSVMVILCGLAACAPATATPGRPVTVTQAPTAQTAPPNVATATALPLVPTATPASTLTPALTSAPPEATSTPAQPKITLITPGGTADEAVLAAVKRAAQEFGWLPEVLPGTAVNAAAQSGAAVIIVDDAAQEDAARAAASAFPSVYFICLHLTGSDLPPNLLALGGAAREDQAGFLAGMAAGFATQGQRVAVISASTSVAGLRYGNGFLHGVRYTCPRCRIDNLEVTDPADTGSAVDLDNKYRLYGVDVFFAAAGEAGNAALVKVVQAGAWGIGSGNDVYITLFNNGATPGADKLLTSVYLDPAAAVYAALTHYHAGTPFAGPQALSAASGALQLAPYRNVAGALSALDEQDITTTLTRLADGSFETGIDPLTGEER